MTKFNHHDFVTGVARAGENFHPHDGAIAVLFDLQGNYVMQTDSREFAINYIKVGRGVAFSLLDNSDQNTFDYYREQRSRQYTNALNYI